MASERLANAERSCPVSTVERYTWRRITQETHLPHCELCESKEEIGCAFQLADTLHGSPTTILENNLKSQKRHLMAYITAAPHPTIKRDKWEDIVLYLPLEQENPPPPTLVVDDKVDR